MAQFLASLARQEDLEALQIRVADLEHRLQLMEDRLDTGQHGNVGEAHMTLKEWLTRAARDLGEEKPPDGEDARGAYIDRLLASEERLGRLERVVYPRGTTVTVRSDTDGTSREVASGEPAFTIQADGRMVMFSVE
jgi:hypothetical protein